MANEQLFDWRILDDADWDAVVFEEDTAFDLPPTLDEDDEEPAEQRPWSGLVGPLVLGGFLIVLVLGIQVWRNYRISTEQLRGDLRVALNEEAWAWQRGDDDDIRALLDPQAGDDWRGDFVHDWEWRRQWAGSRAKAPSVELQDVTLHGDVAEVSVLVDEPGVPWITGAYRETRFYRRDSETWLRTAPRAGVWGAEQHLETDHFRFEYRERDADAVERVAEVLDTEYARLRHEVGLRPAPASRQLTVQIVPRTDVMHWRFSGERLTVPSPVLETVPTSVSNAEYLHQMIMRPLSQRIFSEVLRVVPVRPQWDPLAQGLRYWLWQSADMHMVPSGWRYSMERLLREELARRPSLRLTDVNRWTTWSNHAVRNMVASTVIAYAVETYGRDTVAPLLRASSRNETWETMVPAVYGVSAETFEAGWRAYLAEEYGMPLDSPGQSAQRPSAARN